LTDIFQEIDEELRRDRIVQLWQRHRWAVYAVAGLIVVGTFAADRWRAWQRDQQMALATRFTEADILSSTDAPKAVPQLEVLAAAGSDGYALMARFRAAALKAKTGDKPGAVAGFDAIAADGGVDQAYRDMATIQSALLQVDTAPKDQLLSKVEKLTVAPNPWRFSAVEVSALADLKAGDKDGAQKLYKQLADDADAPQSIRSRASEVLQALHQQG